MSKLRDNINRAYSDQQKLRNAAPSQGISPLTERRANNNRNADSLKMAGTQQAQQGAMSQLAKDPQAVQTGALAQQQQQAAQQRGLQEQQFQPQADTGVKSIEEFQSDAIEKAQENVNAEAQKFNQALASFGSLGSRVGNAVIEEMAQGGEVAAQFTRDAAILDETVQSIAADNADPQQVKDTITSVLDKVESGDVSGAIDDLRDNAGLFKIDGDTSAQLTQIMEALKIDPESQQQMISSAIVDGIINPDEMTLDYLLTNGFLDESELGMNAEELNDEFGSDWKNMTVSQITEAVEKLYDKQTKDKARILKQLQDPNTDPSIKKELRRELQLLDASGVSSAYEAAGRSVERAKQIDKIAIGGELKNIDEVLDDENVKNKTDELLLQLQNNPDKVQSILAEWKEDNPGYEDMGDWILEQQQEVLVKGETATDSSDLLKKRDEEATKTVQENKLFEGQDAEGVTDAHMAVLEELGLVTEGFGKFGNEEFMEKDPTYKALLQKQTDDPTAFKEFMDVLTVGVGDFKFTKETLEGLGGATNLDKIFDTLSNPLTAKQFAHIAQMNEDLENVDFTDAVSEDDQYTALFSAAFGSDHPFNTADKNTIQGYFNQFAKFKEYMVSDEDRAWYEKNKNRKLRGVTLPAKKKRIEKELELEKQFGFDANELENMKNLSAIFDTDGDGKIDNPETIKSTLMGGEKGMFTDGINLKDIGSDEYNALNNLFNNTDIRYDNMIDTHIQEASANWQTNVQDPADKGATFNNDIDNEEPWVTDKEQMKDNPELSKLPKFFSTKANYAQETYKQMNSKVHSNVINALVDNPNFFDSFIKKQKLGGITSYSADWSKFKGWYRKNIGGPKGSTVHKSFKNAIIKAGSKGKLLETNIAQGATPIGQTVISEEEAFINGIKSLYGSLADDIRSKRSQYYKNRDLIREADKGNPFADL